MAKDDEPGRLYWSMIRPLWFSLNERWEEGEDAVVEHLEKLPPRVKHLYAAHWCVSEVCNGGLYQFFGNTTDFLAPEARAAFEAIGLLEWCGILSQGMRFFGEPYPRDRARRCAMLPTWRRGERDKSDPFSDLDTRFYEWLHAQPNRWELAADRYARS